MFPDLIFIRIILDPFWAKCMNDWKYQHWNGCKRHSRVILRMRPANERRRYSVTPSLIGWAHTQKIPGHYSVSQWDRLTKVDSKHVRFWWKCPLSNTVVSKRRQMPIKLSQGGEFVCWVSFVAKWCDGENYITLDKYLTKYVWQSLWWINHISHISPTW